MNNSLLGILTKGSRVTSIVEKDLLLVEETYGKLDRIGVATFCEGQIKCLENQGNLQALSDFQIPDPAHLAITLIEQHYPDGMEQPQPRPELSSNKELALVYSGKLENAIDIHFSLSELGFDFETHLESEAILRLIHRYIDIGMSLLEAIKLSLNNLEGDFAFIVLDARYQELVAACQGYPLTIGIDEQTLYIGSNARILNIVSCPMLQLKAGEAMMLQSIF
ncbi:MAG TPA: hypothetical protein EYP59_21965 [Thiotrichaceae bacterium]|nr:hypothetical protein [Thiotrichaceae bacterium]